MFLENEKLVIRDAELNDAPTICKWWNDGEIMAHAGFPKGLGTNVEEVAKRIRANSLDHKLLVLLCERQLIGEMSYRKVEIGVAEVGIKICERAEQNKGYGKLYLKMLIDYLFNELDYQKIVLDTNLNNLRAQHVYESLGFKKVRVNYDSWKNQLGEPQSSIDYELLRKV